MRTAHADQDPSATPMPTSPGRAEASALKDRRQRSAPRLGPRALDRLGLIVAGGLAALVAAALAAGAATQTPANGPPLELVETVPVETGLGNPKLPAAYDVWLDMIHGAKRSIAFEGFYLSDWPGEPLHPVLEALGQAGARGVAVHILLDQGMHRTYPLPADSLARLPGIEVRTIDFKRIAGGIQHAKFFIVDHEDLFLGSQNFDWRALKHIHELGVRVRDHRTAKAFEDVFNWDWFAADTTRWVQDGSRFGPRRPGAARIAVPIPIVQSPGDTAFVWPSYSPLGFIPDSTRWDEDAVVGLIDAARHEIVVQVLTYAPEEYGEKDEALDRALRLAAGRGVDVKLLVSDWEVNGKGLDWLKRLAQVPHIEVKLSTLPEWSGGYIPFARVEHCKYMVVDSISTWVGTGNWSPGYFHSSRNLGLTIRNRPIGREARQVFETSWTAPSAAALRVDYDYPQKIRGLTPPPGEKAYGN
jgi:phosphatidylserine/phosphatidylglycerophosphate/cardiolipin synthase-like enzyme